MQTTEKNTMDDCDARKEALLRPSERSERSSESRRDVRPSSLIFTLAGYDRSTFSVCLSCRICASVCTVNDLGIDTNPQDLLSRLFLGRPVEPSDSLVRNCTSCYRCSAACPWHIRIPEVVRALREEMGLQSPFEKAFKGSVRIWGRVYEPYVFLMAVSYLIKEGYWKYMARWMEYASVHLPHKVRRLKGTGGAGQGRG